jgi:hypothetical protein
VSSIIQKRRNLSIWPKAKQYHPRRRRVVRPVI